MTEDEQVQRARDAKALLENPLLEQAFAAVEAHFVGMWKTSEYGATSKRETAYHMIAAIPELRAKLTQWVNDGRIIESRRRKHEVT